MTISPIRDSRGRIVGASKIARDISEQERAEAALRDSEARLRFTLEAGADRRLGPGPRARAMLRGSARFERCFGYGTHRAPTGASTASSQHVHPRGSRRRRAALRAGRGRAARLACRMPRAAGPTTACTGSACTAACTPRPARRPTCSASSPTSRSHKLAEEARLTAAAAGGREPADPGGQPAQEPVPGQHVARAAHAAERDHRLRRPAAAGEVPPDSPKHQRVPRPHRHQRAPPAAADQRRARPVQGRVGQVRVLPRAGGAAAAGQGGRRHPAHGGCSASASQLDIDRSTRRWPTWCSTRRG